MNLWPVIERELRVEARAASTHALRPVGAMIALFALWTTLSQPGFPRAAGGSTGEALFLTLHQLLLGTIWLLVPLMAADCVSRERREQTLGLLFLTPLRPWEILTAKALAQGLRAATVCLAVLPMLTLPLLLGGVRWSTVVASALINTSAFVWALTAGVVATTLSRSLLAGFFWALLWSALFVATFALLNGVALFTVLFQRPGATWYLPSLEAVAGLGLLTLWQAEPHYTTLIGPAPGPGPGAWLVAATGVLTATVLGAAGFWALAALGLSRLRTGRPPSVRKERLETEATRPRIATALLRRRQQRWLNTNPAAWLERRRWTSRLAAWAWTGLACLAAVGLLNHFSSSGGYTSGQDLVQAGALVLVALVGALTLAAATSFRRERESGALELLLTTPLTPEALIRGRALGLWSQFIWAFGGWLALLLVIATMLSPNRPWLLTEEVLPTAAWVGCGAIAAPLAAFLASLRSRSWLVPFPAGLIAGLFGPYVLSNLAFGFATSGSKGSAPLLAAMPWLLIASFVAAAWGWTHLARRLGWAPALAALGFLALPVLAMILSGEIESAFRLLAQAWFAGDRRVLIEQMPALMTPALQLTFAGAALRSLHRVLAERTYAHDHRPAAA